MLERTPEFPPIIVPLRERDVQPRWSVMIPTYNCLHYLKKTLESVLLQDHGAGQMQIEVVDDCSTDGDVKALVEEVGKGRVGFFKQDKNSGSLRNFETCINRAKGQLVHILHGDDFVAKGFYEEIELLFTRFPEIGAAFTDYIHVDERDREMWSTEPLLTEPGVLQNWLIKIAQEQRIQYSSMVVKRSVYEHLGSFYAVHFGEDWEMWTRIAAHYSVAHSPKLLAMYRVHTNSISGGSFSNGQTLQDIDKVINIIQGYLPAHEKVRVKRLSRKKFSIYYARTSNKYYHDSKNIDIAIKQANAAIKFDFNLTTLSLVVKLYIKYIIRYKRNS